MRRIIRKSLLYCSIIILLSLGVIGVVLPIIPQTIFFLSALILISFEFPSVQIRIESFLQNYPKVKSLYLKLKNRLEKLFLY